MAVFCLTFHPLGDSFHGRGYGDEPEWPPSPLRAYQALVNAAAGRWGQKQLVGYAVPSLRWLEGIGPPEVVVPPGRTATRSHRLYVPNNAGDLMVSAWARGDSRADMADHRTEKDVRPTRFPTGQAIHYVWSLTPDQRAEGQPHFDTLEAAARSITHLGWGVDMVAGNAAVLDEAQISKLEGEVWRPTSDNAGTPLRVPVEGTLTALMDKHAKFLGRLSADGFKPVPPLSAFAVARYRRATDVAGRPFAAFQILKPDASGYRAFDTARRARDVAAWVRHATGSICKDWPDVAAFVHGHDAEGNQAKGTAADRRFQYLPLPSIERRADLGDKVGDIRRVLIAVPADCRDRLDSVRRRLPGQELQELTDNGPRVCGLLNILPTSDWVLKQYTDAARVWSTVTPVIWPGYDDRNAGKAEKLLRKAFVDAGLSQEMVDGIEELEWRPVGFRTGLDLARNYRRPDRLTGSVYHVRVCFPHPVRGPLAVGAGRYRGLGVFAREAPV